MGRLDGKVAIITGAASGMGLADARLFAKEGAKVVGVDIQADLLKEKMNEIKAGGGDVLALRMDVASAADWKDVIAQTINKYGKIDILVNNAGIHRGKNILDAEDEEWNSINDVNGKGVFYGMKYVAPEMIKNGGGSIINISSLSGFVGGFFADGGDGPYAYSKGGVRALTKHAAQVLAPNNVRVNVIHPGGVKTPIAEELIKTNPQVAEKMKEYNPLPPHMAEAEDIAYGTLYLASDDAKFVTGIELTIDGGFISR